MDRAKKDRAVKDSAAAGKTTSFAEVKARSASIEPAAVEAAAKKPRRGLKLFLIGAGAILAALTFITQAQRMQELRTEREALQNQLLERQNQTQRLERMIQYSQTDSYVERMALKQFGMVKEGEILFYADPEDGALITAPVPEDAQASGDTDDN